MNLNFSSDMKVIENNTSVALSNFLAPSQRLADEAKTLLLETDLLDDIETKRSKVRFVVEDTS